MLLKCCTQYASKFAKLSSGHRTGKMSHFITISKKDDSKECSNYHTIALFSYTSKVMLKILHARLQQSMNWEIPVLQAGFRKGREIRDKIANIHWIIEKGRELRKKSASASLTTLMPLTVRIATNWKNPSRDGKYQTTWPASWETCMQVKKQQLEPDMKQRTGSKWGKEYIKAVYCHPAYSSYIQNVSCEMLDLMKEPRLPGEISITSDMQMIPPLWQKMKRN